MIKSASCYLQTARQMGWGESSVLDKERLVLIKQFIAGKKVLDIGCGFGLYVDYLSSRGFQAFGVDFVEDFIKTAKKTKKGNFVKGDANCLPFKDKTFDTVLLFDILEHGDDEKILLEAKRVAKKIILAVVPRKVDYRLEQSGVLFRHYLDKSHLREYEKEDIEELAGKTGLKIRNLTKIHALYNETIFLSLFDGPAVIRKIIRKIVFFLLPKAFYPTEYFIVFAT